MQTISKGTEPPLLTQWKHSNPNSRYADLTDELRQVIRKACAAEQLYLCAYCGKEISASKSDTVNEHVEAQRLAPNRSLDFSNIVASCNTRKQCDKAHGSQNLPLTPLMSECETELSYGIDGCVAGLTQEAETAIDILNLGRSLATNKALVEQRRQLAQTLILREGVGPSSDAEDDALLLILIDELQQPENGRLTAYSPALVNILRSWLGTPPNKVGP